MYFKVLINNIGFQLWTNKVLLQNEKQQYKMKVIRVKLG